MPKTNLDILEDLLYKVGKMSEDDVSVTEFEVFSELLEKLKDNMWLNEKYRGDINNDNV